MRPTVLILDNDAAVRDLLQLALQQGGIESESVADGEEAERALLAREFQLALIDLNLGSGKSGQQLACAWSAAGILPPFLVVTGMPDDPRIGFFASLPGFQGVVAKPFVVLELVQQVRRLARAGAHASGADPAP